MAATKRTDPKLWEKVKEEIRSGDKGGEGGEWSARKAQLAVQEYKKRGGRYVGTRDPHNHLVEWTREDWGTGSGRPSGETHERYLPKEARAALTDGDYARTTAKKRADTRNGKQFSAQPADIAKKTARFRHSESGDMTKAQLLAEARKRAIPGRTLMDKAALRAALA